MAQSESVSQFNRFLRERHSTLKESIPLIHQTFVKADIDKRKEAVQNVLFNAKTIRSNLAAPDVPRWLSSLIGVLEWYVNNSHNSDVQHLFLSKVAPIIIELENYEWNFDKIQGDTGFDFDAIYEECKRNSKIDELFESIIDILQKIIDSEEIDSIKVNKAINDLISTLKLHNSASYFSIHGCWDFLERLMKNILWEQLESLPILGPLVKGLKKTLEETRIEMIDLDSKIKSNIQVKYDTEFSFLDVNKTKLLNED